MKSIGADPELFVRDMAGSIVPGIGKIGGEKREPLQIGGGVGVQEDNVLLEFTLNPCSAERFPRAINLAMQRVRSYAASKGLVPVVKASHLFRKEVLDSYGPKALEFGCDPDYNAYSNSVNPSPNPDTCLRSAGGHVHVGTSKDALSVVQAMDLLLGLPSVIMDDDDRRKQLYGKAGAHRIKPYGVEYRTLSNFWLKNSSLIKWVASSTEKAESLAEGARVMMVNHGGIARLEEIINNNDKAQAWYVLNRLGIPTEAV